MVERGSRVKIRINAEELISILVKKHKRPLLNKYSLDNDKITKIKESLQKGRWRIVF